jgi:hypothetical protein
MDSSSTNNKQLKIDGLLGHRLVMRWPAFWSSSSTKDDEENKTKSSALGSQTPGEVLDNILSTSKSPPSAPPLAPKSTDWSALVTTSFSQHFTSRENLIPTLILTSTCLAFYTFYRSYLRRIPAAGNISPGFFRNRSLLGRVTSVGDGDNFRVFHTPGGRLAGWGWLPWRRVPKEKKDLKNKTVSCDILDVVQRCGF